MIKFQIPRESQAVRHAHLAYCRICERRGTRHGLLVLSMVRPDCVSSAAATCSDTEPRSGHALLPVISFLCSEAHAQQLRPLESSHD